MFGNPEDGFQTEEEFTIVTNADIISEHKF